MRVSVVTITCRRCGRVVSQSIPRAAGADEIPTEQSCSPAFASWAECPDHPAAPPRLGLTYADGEHPLLWAVRQIELTGQVDMARQAVIS